MTRQRRDRLLELVQSFFQQYLRGTRGASDHTIRAYRDALRLFFMFLVGRRTRSVADLTLEDIDADGVLAFLDHGQSQRHNSVATRNCRLVAIRSFVRHALRHDLARADQYGRILAIGSKRAPVRVITYLEPEDARAVIAAVDARSRHAVRDRALLLLLYNTGARVSEALAIRPRALHLDRLPQVRVYGKGAKERHCPLWSETAAVLRRLVRSEAHDEPIFRNARGAPLTRDGVAYILGKYVRRAAEARPDSAGPSNHSPCDEAQLCRRAAPGGCRRVRDSRLSGTRVGGHHQPIHHEQSQNETRRARHVLEARRLDDDVTPPMAPVAQAPGLAPIPVA